MNRGALSQTAVQSSAGCAEPSRFSLSLVLWEKIFLFSLFLFDSFSVLKSLSLSFFPLVFFPFSSLPSLSLSFFLTFFLSVSLSSTWVSFIFYINWTVACCLHLLAILFWQIICSGPEHRLDLTLSTFIDIFVYVSRIKAFIFYKVCNPYV